MSNIKQWQIDREIQNHGSASPFYGKQSPGVKQGQSGGGFAWRNPGPGSDSTRRSSGGSSMGNIPRTDKDLHGSHDDGVASMVAPLAEELAAIDPTRKSKGEDLVRFLDNSLTILNRIAEEADRARPAQKTEAKPDMLSGLVTTNPRANRSPAEEVYEAFPKLGSKFAPVRSPAEAVYTPESKVSPQEHVYDSEAVKRSIGELLSKEASPRLQYATTPVYDDYMGWLSENFGAGYNFGDGPDAHLGRGTGAEAGYDLWPAMDRDQRHQVPFVSTHGGEIVHAGPLGDRYGNTIIVHDGQGNYQLYAHASDIPVQVGQHVHPGQKIGFIGDTGINVTGPHLHYEAIRGGEFDGRYMRGDRYDPTEYLRMWYGY